LEKRYLDVVTIQEVRGVEGGSQPADEYTFLYVNGNASHHIWTGLFVNKRIIPAVKGV
jgi:hypothetical protein